MDSNLRKDLSIQQVRWPGYMEFEEGSKENYTLLNQGQGLLIPNNWAVALENFRLTDSSSPPADICLGSVR